jgi:pyruvate decarboxylase
MPPLRWSAAARPRIPHYTGPHPNILNLRGFHHRARKTIPLAIHILRRLRQHGCSALHGVPGDFTLPFLSYLAPTGMTWVGNCNELNAAYAADGYARVKGLGAVCTTYGVGELSAINGIAGSYAERVSVVHIVGTPRTELGKFAEDGGKGSFKGLVHHALGRGRRMGVYRELAEKVVADVVRLDTVAEDEVVRRVDGAIRTCLTEKRPVYIDLPSDYAALQVEDKTDEPLETDERRASAQSFHESHLLRHVLLKKLARAQRPLIMVDGLAASFGWEQLLNKLVEVTGIPTLVTTHGLGIVDSDHANYYGVYTGSLGHPRVKEYVDNSDFVMLFGELFSDTATGGWDAVPKEEVTTTFSSKQVSYPIRDGEEQARTEVFSGNVSFLLDNMLTDILQATNGAGGRDQKPGVCGTYEGRSFRDLLPPKENFQIGVLEAAATAPISQDYLWPRLSSYFRPNDTILLANGTPLIGGAMFRLPSPVRVIASGLWFSIGQMLPAAQGVSLALAQSDLQSEQRGRTILLEGDGSFQTTAQELSTIIRNKLDMTIILVNNKGYAYERLILGPEAGYNAVADWDYTLAPAMMGGKTTPDYPIFTAKVDTVGALEELLEGTRMNESRGLRFIEVIMGEKDVPSYFFEVLRSSGKKLGGNADS